MYVGAEAALDTSVPAMQTALRDLWLTANLES